MAKELVVNQTHNESRIALIENGEILDFLIERHPQNNASSPIVGNIYLGRVLRVLPGMQSAFMISVKKGPHFFMLMMLIFRRWMSSEKCKVELQLQKLILKDLVK